MIVSIGGISTSIPAEYAEIIAKLKKLGLTPTGNPSIDRALLVQAINERVKKIEEKKKEELKKIEKNNPKDEERKKLEEERLGAKALGEQNRIFFNI